MQGLFVASRGLSRAVWSATKFRTVIGCMGARGSSSRDVVRKRYQPGVFDAILMARSQIGTLESLKQDARHSLTDALKTEELHIHKVKEDIFVGNSHGLDFVKLADRLDTELAAQNHKIAVQNHKIAAQNRKIAAQKLKIAARNDKIAAQSDEIVSLKQVDSDQDEHLRYLLRSHAFYKSVRNRYLSTFKRDFLGIHTTTDEEIIESGNLTVHWGDAITDSSLYTEPDGRTDVEVFQQLYGLLPGTIERIRDERTVDALDTRAGVVGSKRKEGSEKFSNLFAKLIKELEKSGSDETDLDGKDTNVTQACREFMDCIDSEVKSVRSKKH